MKTRHGLVSNSSSSSFIIIGSPSSISDSLINRIKTQLTDNTIILDDRGETEFGWSHVRYETFWDRLNFTMIQIMSIHWKNPEEIVNDEKYKMLQKVLKDVLGVDTIDNKLTLKYDDESGKIHSYIDHQSCLTEGQNGEMFKSESELINFLFSDDSYIQGGNDNE